MKRGSVGCGTVLVVVLLGIFFGYLVTKPSGNSSKPASSTANTYSSPPRVTATPAPKPKVPGDQWSYSHSTDSMSDGKVHYASVKSSNTVNFSFPYSGRQHATLSLRTHPRYGKDVIFLIEKGQLPCSSYDGCHVLIRFDDGAAVKYRANGAADNSSELLFIKNYHGFVGNMLKAKTVRIAAEVYQDGNPMFEFDVSNFATKNTCLTNKVRSREAAI